LYSTSDAHLIGFLRLVEHATLTHILHEFIPPLLLTESFPPNKIESLSRCMRGDSIASAHKGVGGEVGKELNFKMASEF